MMKYFKTEIHPTAVPQSCSTTRPRVRSGDTRRQIGIQSGIHWNRAAIAVAERKFTMSKKSEHAELSIIGTWEMVEAWDIGDDPKKPKKKTYPWGNPPAGYWVYDTSGHFSLIISRNPPLAIPADPYPGAGATNQPVWLSPTAPWKVPYELLI